MIIWQCVDDEVISTSSYFYACRQSTSVSVSILRQLLSLDNVQQVLVVESMRIDYFKLT